MRPIQNNINYKNYLCDYDYKEDILFVYRENAKSRETIEVRENFHIDIDKDKEIVSLEIWEASEFLKKLGSGNKKLNKNMLKRIKKIKLKTEVWKNYLIIKMIIFVDDEKIQEKLNVPAYNSVSPMIEALNM